MAGASASPASPPVLSIDEATVAARQLGPTGVLRGDLEAQAGDLVLVGVRQPDEATALADVASGLLAPTGGTVRFLGYDWASLDPETGGTLRAQVGRVFARGNWIGSASLADNILLPALHHTQRSVESLQAEALELARALGLPGLPLGMPRATAQAELQRAACVRAFLGLPRLLLLEDPTYTVRAELTPRLVRMIRRARDGGAAVVWLTHDPGIWHDRSMPATRRYRVVGEDLRPARHH